MKKQNQDMLRGPLLGSIISYTIPIILTSVLQLLFNAADLVVHLFHQPIRNSQILYTQPTIRSL